MGHEYIGVEIGGTKQQVASFDERGEIIQLHSERIALHRGAADILDWMKETIPKLKNKKTAGIGIGFGGIVATESGTSACSVHVKGWNRFPIKDFFEKTFKLPATVVNDTVCGGYAELLFGAGKGIDRFFYTNIGTGCGGAMFLDGRSYDGIGTGGSYHGQIYVPSWDAPNTPIRMEEICRGPAIEARLRTEGYVPKTSILHDLCEGKVERLTCKDWGNAIKAGDEFSISDMENWARSYSTALSTLITLLAPRKIAIGGGVSMIGAPLFEAIRRHTDDLIFISMKDSYEIVPCKTEELAVLIGAAMYARDGFKAI